MKTPETVSIVAALDRGKYSPYNCMCRTPGFDIDAFARVFVPDPLLDRNLTEF
jgi:hypothetical protein